MVDELSGALSGKSVLESGFTALERLLPAVSRETKGLLDRYVDLLFQWNAKTNLTGSATPEDFYIHHLLDVCCAQIALEKKTHELKLLNNPSLICQGESEITLKDGIWLDVGSGGGIPGIPWAILWPETRFGLVEVRQKKAAFLDRAVSLLCLKKTKVFSCLVEHLHSDLEKNWRTVSCNSAGTVDQGASASSENNLYIVSRGTADPRGLLRLAHRVPFSWKYWFVFSSEKTQDQFRCESSKLGLGVDGVYYERPYEPYLSQGGKGLLTILYPLAELES